MHIVQELLMQWRNGNRKEAIVELSKLGSAAVREFMLYLSHDDKATALIIALNMKDD